MSKFDPDWPHGHRTAGGAPARLLPQRALSDWPFIAIITIDGLESVVQVSDEGISPDGRLRLHNAPPPTKKSLVDRLAVLVRRPYGHACDPTYVRLFTSESDALKEVEKYRAEGAKCSDPFPLVKEVW